MIGRITSQQQLSVFIDQMFQQRNQLEDVRQEIASGLKIAEASDDPGRAGAVAQFQSTLARLNGHKERITYARNFLENQENSLDSAQEILTRAKEIAAQTANETLGSDERALLQEEVFELRDALVSIANTQYQGRYIYGGGDDDDPPFDLAAGGYTVPVSGSPHDRWVFDAEAGTALTRSVRVSEDDTVRVNSSAQMFAQGISSLERLGRALSGFRTDPEDFTTLPTGAGVAYTFPADYAAQSAAIRGCIDEIQLSKDTLEAERGDLGSRLNRLDQAKDILENVILRTDEARSNLQSADIFEASANLANLETSLQALLASGARINNLSLLDFL
jgi:flagellar hook-associated protein 3 FlgL